MSWHVLRPTMLEQPSTRARCPANGKSEVYHVIDWASTLSEREESIPYLNRRILPVGALTILFTKCKVMYVLQVVIDAQSQPCLCDHFIATRTHNALSMPTYTGQIEKMMPVPFEWKTCTDYVNTIGYIVARVYHRVYRIRKAGPKTPAAKLLVVENCPDTFAPRYSSVCVRMQLVQYWLLHEAKSNRSLSQSGRSLSDDGTPRTPTLPQPIPHPIMATMRSVSDAKSLEPGHNVLRAHFKQRLRRRLAAITRAE